MNEVDRVAPAAKARVHLPALLTALGLMLVGTLYPPLLTDATGQADHRLALLAMWAMSAGFVRGVGFLPRLRLWRWLFSTPAMGLALAAALLLRLS